MSFHKCFNILTIMTYLPKSLPDFGIFFQSLKSRRKGYVRNWFVKMLCLLKSFKRTLKEHINSYGITFIGRLNLIDKCRTFLFLIIVFIKIALNYAWLFKPDHRNLTSLLNFNGKKWSIKKQIRILVWKTWNSFILKKVNELL